VTVVLKASDRVNPGATGDPLPTAVRLLQVRSSLKLGRVELTDLWDHEKDVLAEDFVGMQDYTLDPGQEVRATVTPTPETKELVAIALFQQPTGSLWRARQALPPVGERPCAGRKDADADGGEVRFLLRDNRVEASKRETGR
jgi:type VI secretion system VasD/TssJ family lipoprotein